MKRVLGSIVFFIAMGFIFWGCNALDYNANEEQENRLSAKDSETPAIPVKPFGGHVDAVLPYLYRSSWIADDNEQKPYFFNGENYNRVKFAPGSNNDELLVGTTKITNAWPSLRKAGFDRVDATLVLTKDENTNTAYFFKDDKYIKVKYTYGGGDELLVGPTKITDGWPSLKEAGFDHVDAAFPIYMNYNKTIGAYIFSDYYYVKIELDRNMNDRLIAGPTKNTHGWKTFMDTSFTTIDAALPVNGYPNDMFRPWHRVFFFSGDRYLYMKFDAYGDGEELISGPNKITAGWPFLR